MTPFEYSLVFVTIIVGLAIADMLMSLHRLLRARRQVRWALPDEERDRWDLAAYYEENRQYFWTLFSFVAFMAVLTNLVGAIQRDPPSTLFFKAVPNLLYAGAMLSLAFVRARAFHYGLVFLLLLVMVLGWFPVRLE